MNKYVWLVLIGLALVGAEFGLDNYITFHRFYQVTVIFFIIQTGILFRIEDRGPENLKVQLSMVKMGLRLLSAMAFALIMGLKIDEGVHLFFIQFIILYLVFMTFEIILALANLRRNSETNSKA